MATFPRFIKQFIIAALFFAVLFGVSIWLWILSRPKPSCFDGIRNQNEEGVDCGGLCTLACKKEPLYESISALNTRLIEISKLSYDVLGFIENKNADFGSPVFGYEFIFLDASSVPVASRRGTSYILPREKKKIAEQRIETDRKVHSVKLDTFDEKWIEVDEFENVNLNIRDKIFSPIEESAVGEASKASGVVVNNTGFDFDQVDIVVILMDEDRKELVWSNQAHVP